MGNEVLDTLRKAIIQCDVKLAVESAKRAVDEKLDPIDAINAMTESIRQVGDRFGSGELFLPDLIGAAEAMLRAMPILEDEIKRAGIKRESRGTVVLGTARGDIHSIGKTMVASLLVAAGFDVHDLGVNVAPANFVKAVKEFDADLLGMSALLTTSAVEQKKTIQALKEEGIRDRVKVMVGGAAISQEFADSIGADGYEPTAPLAVELAKKLLGK